MSDSNVSSVTLFFYCELILLFLNFDATGQEAMQKICQHLSIPFIRLMFVERFRSVKRTASNTRESFANLNFGSSDKRLKNVGGILKAREILNDR